MIRRTLGAMLLGLLLPGAVHAQGMFARPGSSLAVIPFVGYQLGFDMNAAFTRTGADGAVSGTWSEEIDAGMVLGLEGRVPIAHGLSVQGGLGWGSTGDVQVLARAGETNAFATREGVSILFLRLGLAYTLPTEIPLELSLAPAYIRVDPVEEEGVAAELTVPYSGWAIQGGAALAFPLSEQVSWTLTLEHHYIVWDGEAQRTRTETFYERGVGIAVDVEQETEASHLPVVRLGLAIDL